MVAKTQICLEWKVIYSVNYNSISRFKQFGNEKVSFLGGLQQKILLSLPSFCNIFAWGLYFVF